VGVGDGSAVGVELGVGEATGVGVAVGVDFGTEIDTPLFQTNFLPLFTHVNFLPFAVAVTPTFLQLSPAFTAAIAFIGTRNSAKAMNEPSHFFI
jgi:hypothetical protein